MKKIERNQMTKIRIYLNPCLTSHDSLICEGILVGDLNRIGKGDSGDDAASTKGATTS
jgi:hypothetical protein